MDIGKQAYKYAVRNAFEHSGKADVGAVVGKLKALFPGIEARELAGIAKKHVEKANSLDGKKLEEEFHRFEKQGFELGAREGRVGLPELEWAEKEKVVTRFAPNPNGPLHLGSARAAVLSHEYARKYDGKFILRFDDTDPKVKKPIENAERFFLEDLEWLDCKVDERYFASDRLELYQKYMKKLILKQGAYVCTCDAEEWREKTKKGEACDCRSEDRGTQLEKFKKILSHKFKEGEAVLRIKTDLKHKDPSVRDWWIAKIVDSPQHPRVGKKVHVWPSYNFASGVDDHELGITLIIRGQEHQQNETKQRFLYDYFEWEYPHSIYTGRLQLEGAVLSTSKIRTEIEAGKYRGWDDPRLGTICAFRRRGFFPEALRKVILDLGIKGRDALIEWETIAAENRELVVEEAKKTGFAQRPLILIVEKAKKKNVLVDGKEFSLGEKLQSFTVERSDVEGKEGKEVRLREAYNVRIKRTGKLKAFAEFTCEKPVAREIIPWFLEGVQVKIMMPNGRKIEGLADESILSLEKGEHCYLNRFGFAIVDSAEKEKTELWFTHA